MLIYGVEFVYDGPDNDEIHLHQTTENGDRIVLKLDKGQVPLVISMLEDMIKG